MHNSLARRRIKLQKYDDRIHLVIAGDEQANADLTNCKTRGNAQREIEDGNCCQQRGLREVAAVDQGSSS